METERWPERRRLPPGSIYLSLSDAAARSTRSYGSVFNSATPQRAIFAAKKMQSRLGHAIGPQTYHVPAIKWDPDPARGSSAFLSRTHQSKSERPMTWALDFLKDPGEHDRRLRPRAWERALPWGVLPQRLTEKQMGDTMLGTATVGYPGADGCHKKPTFGTMVEQTPQRYAATFKSRQPQRFSYPANPEMGPGKYADANPPCIKVTNPQRESYAFRATNTSMFDVHGLVEPPDALLQPYVDPPGISWTAKGLPYSTRARFPRVRKRWDNG